MAENALIALFIGVFDLFYIVVVWVFGYWGDTHQEKKE